MASARPRRRDIMGEEPPKLKRSGGYMETSSDNFPQSLSRRARKAAESAARVAATEDIPRATTMASKIPATTSSSTASSSTSSSRKEPYAWKHTLASQSRAASSTVASDVSGKASQTSATTTTTARSLDSAKHPRNLLRRKMPNVSQDRSLRTDSSRSTHTAASSSLDSSEADRSNTASPAEIRVAQRVEIPTTSATQVTIYPELDRYRDYQPQATITNPAFELPLYPLTTNDLPPPTPLFSGGSSFSGSPSTRWSESPGPGPYSRDTTPTSMSSVSPGLVAPMRLPARGKQSTSPAETRPPVTRRRAGSASHEAVEPATGNGVEGLASVRESSNSSSSTSTVRAAIQKRAAPMPPPRTSSEGSTSRNRATGQTAASMSRSQENRTHSKPPSVHQTRPSLEACIKAPQPPPRRPSRDGTMDFHSQVSLPLPVVHSNLSSTSLAERRRSGQMLGSSRTTTPQQLEQASRVGREPTPAPQAAPTTSRATARTPSPSVASTFKTRFPLFRRHKTSDSTSAAAEKKEKAPRKGPAAGTGHEGYGRLGQVRRRSSNLTSALRVIPGTMSSQESLASNNNANTPSDPFLAERLNPVVIAGGEIIHNRNLSSDFGGSTNPSFSTLPRPSMSSRNNSDVSLTSSMGEMVRNTLWPSALPRGEETPQATTSTVRHRRMPSDSSDSDVLTMRSTLAYRRSIHRLDKAAAQGGSATAAGRLPKPISTRGGAPPPSVTSHDTTLLSDDSTFSLRGPRPMAVRNASGSSEMKAAKKLTKRPKSPRKWNIFSRSTASSSAKKEKEKEQQKQRDASSSSQVSASVKAAEKQPIAFYAMLDGPEGQDEEDGFADVEDVLREAAQGGKTNLPKQQTLEHSVPVPSPVAATERGEPRPGMSRNHSEETDATPVERRTKQMIETKPASKTTNQPTGMTSSRAAGQRATTINGTTAPATEQQPCHPSQTPTASRPVRPRPSRLPQVGRIPRVNTTRPVEPPLPSPMSFSRPFNRVSIQLPSPTIAQAPAPVDEFIAKGPSPPEPSSPIPPPEVYPDEQVATPSAATEPQPQDEDDANTPPVNEFVIFPPTTRKVSGGASISGSSSSGAGLSYSDATAVIPEANAPLAEDEVWDEYNDLLADEDGPMARAHPSTSSSLGRPFHLEVWGKRLAAASTQTSQSASGFVAETPIVPGRMQAEMNAHLDTVESECETEFEMDGEREDDEGQRIQTFPEPEPEPDLEPEPQPPTQPEPEPAPTASSSVYSSDLTAKINEVLEAAGGERASFSLSEFVSGYGSQTNSGSVPPSSNNQRTSTTSSLSSQQAARLLRDSSSSQASDDNSAIAQVNLRVGSMTVSKWLTFGHVLFSPVRDELMPVVGSLKRHSILVIDGLGNDDWSFYAAETYPAATFFNLSPRAPVAPQPSSGSSLTPPNHHQIQYRSHADRLPFGPHSFTAVVYRFPTAQPESHFRNIINEARRVLRPGGYIELAILDMDMHNMGNRARRAARKLKERIHIRAPEVSLSSSSDLLLRLLGRKGFAEIKTCRVGVPLASTLAPTPAAGMKRGSRKRETKSLAEMMSAEGPGADESITKMVAKVGRWWYERCYESIALDAGGAGAGKGRSMWSDPALLAECEEWRTSLKLMVCHARIPDGRGRLASI